MDQSDQYWPRPTDKSNTSGSKGQRAITSPGRADPSRSEWISRSARMVLSSYRRDDFADPDGYLVQVGMVLDRYPDAVIREATNPISGIQRTCKWPPSIAEMVEFCNEMQRRASYAGDWHKRTQEQIAERGDFTLPPDDRPPGNFANVFVPPNAPQYVDMIEKAKTGDPCEWRYDEKRPGIWVALGWIKPSWAGGFVFGAVAAKLQTPEAFRSKYALTAEQWNAIPDAK